jgi:hypothetical protein
MESIQMEKPRRYSCYFILLYFLTSLWQRGSNSKKHDLPKKPTAELEMPPPEIIPLPVKPAIESMEKQPAVHLLPEKIGITPISSSRIPPIKSAGFKPIPQANANAAVKKFFPDEEEDASDTLMAAPEIPPLSEPPVLETVQPDQDSIFRSAQSVPPSSPKAHLSEDALQMDEIPRQETGSQRQSSDNGEVKTPNTSSQQHSTRQTNELYHIVSQVGEGTFGKVYKALNVVSNMHYALKRIRMESERDGFPVTAMREIKLLQSLRHDNVVRLYEMMVSNGKSVRDISVLQ